MPEPAPRLDEAAPPVLERVQDFVLRRRASEFPDDVLLTARILLLDTLGIVIAAGPMEAGVISRDTASLLYGTGDPAVSARMLFDGRRVRAG